MAKVVFRPRRPLFTVNARIRTPQEVALSDLQVGMQQIRLEDLEIEHEKKQKFESGLQMINENPQWNADEKGMAYVKLQELYMPEEAVQSRMERSKRVDMMVRGTDITTPEMTQALDTWQELAISRGSERAFKEINKAVKQSNLRRGLVGVSRGATDAQLRASAAQRFGHVYSWVISNPDVPDEEKVGLDVQSLDARTRRILLKYSKKAGVSNLGADIVFLGSRGDLNISRLEEATIPLREVQAETPSRNRFELYVNDAQYNREKVFDEYMQRINQLDTSMLPGWFATSKESDIKNFFEGDAGEVNKLQKENPELYATLMEMYLLITGQYEQYARSRLNREQNVGGFMNTRINQINTGNAKPKL